MITEGKCSNQIKQLVAALEMASRVLTSLVAEGVVKNFPVYDVTHTEHDEFNYEDWIRLETHTEKLRLQILELQKIMDLD